MISVVLVALIFAVVQLVVFLHVRNVVAASATQAAGYAARADVADPGAGCARAKQIVADGLSKTVSRSMGCTGTLDSGGREIALHVTARVPLVFSWLGSIPGVTLDAHALLER